MDKFGIFKLLNSFFNFYSQNKQEETSKSTDEKSPLDQLFSAIKPSSTPQNKKEEPITVSPTRPLQSGMLKTINSHDDIIKRAKLNAQKQSFSPPQ